MTEPIPYPLGKVSVPLQLQPNAHQAETLQESWDKPYYAVLWEMGLGKTKLALDTAAALYTHRKIDALLIVAPKGVCPVWLSEEIPRHLRVPYRLSYWKTSLSKKHTRELEDFARPFSGLSVVVVNTEGFSSKKLPMFANWFVKQFKSCMIVLDESVSIKAPGSIRSKALRRLSKQCTYRRILTGSPITETPLAFYTQYEFLRPGFWGFNYLNFRNYYGVTETIFVRGKEVTNVVGHRNLDHMMSLVRSISSIRKKADCLDLPPKTYITRHVELSAPQKKMYKELQETFVSQYSDTEVITVEEVITLLLRLHQIVCGFWRPNDSECPQDLPNTRIQELLSVLGEAQGKGVIWAKYRHNVVAIAKAICETYGPESLVLIQADLSIEERGRALRRFQTDPEARYFLSSQALSGKGTTLTEANFAVYFSQGYSLEERLQSEDRIHRIGQSDPVTYVDLICPDTIDERILRMLKNKRNLMDELLTKQPHELRDFVAKH